MNKNIKTKVTDNLEVVIIPNQEHEFLMTTKEVALYKNAQPHQVFWTKCGIVRLGFFIKSERARLFRDWAEDLVVIPISFD